MKRYGATILELLVVSGIIAFLACTAAVVLTDAVEKARTTKCASNLRQIGLAVRLYALEHDGAFPVEETCGNPQSRLVDSLVPRYITQWQVFYCPSADQVEPYAQSNEYGGPGGDSVIQTEENWRRRYISYKYYSVLKRDPRTPLPLRISEYPHILHEQSPPYRWLMSDWVRKDVPVFPHREPGGWGGGRNVLFVGGYVRFVRHRTVGAFTDYK